MSFILVKAKKKIFKNFNYKKNATIEKKKKKKKKNA